MAVSYERGTPVQVAVETYPGGPLAVTRDVTEAEIDDIFADITSKSK